MSRRSQRTLAGVPMKPYDLLREGATVFAAVALLTVALAVAFGAPDYPAIRAADVAQRQPLAFLETAARFLAGRDDLQHYGPPFTADRSAAQRVFGVAPATWFGVTQPLDARRDLVLRPLQRAAVLDAGLRTPLRRYLAAPAAQRRSWATAYLRALQGASVHDGRVAVPAANDGPVPAMLDAMLALGRSGMLEGTLDASSLTPFGMDRTRALLFFEGPVDHAVAGTLNLLGADWGIGHETGAYPGAWWLWPYTVLYQVPPMAQSPNGDLQVILIVVVLLVLLPTLAPFVPGVNRLPHWLPFHRIVWRRWYGRRVDGEPEAESR